MQMKRLRLWLLVTRHLKIDLPMQYLTCDT
jgi:hypothetical protein